MCNVFLSLAKTALKRKLWVNPLTLSVWSLEPDEQLVALILHLWWWEGISLSLKEDGATEWCHICKHWMTMAMEKERRYGSVAFVACDDIRLIFCSSCIVQISNLKILHLATSSGEHLGCVLISHGSHRRSAASIYLTCDETRKLCSNFFVFVLFFIRTGRAFWPLNDHIGKKTHLGLLFSLDKQEFYFFLFFFWLHGVMIQVLCGRRRQ